MVFLRQQGMLLQRASQQALRRAGGAGAVVAPVPRRSPVCGRQLELLLLRGCRSFLSVARPASSTASSHPTTAAVAAASPRPILARQLLPPSSPSSSPTLLNRHVRHCSHRRNMCKHFGADNEGQAMAVHHAREVLPTNVKPLHYDLTLEPQFDTATYTGSVTIEYPLPTCPPSQSVLTPLQSRRGRRLDRHHPKHHRPQHHRC